MVHGSLQEGFYAEGFYAEVRSQKSEVFTCDLLLATCYFPYTPSP
jgi:hypothetical protein